MKYLFLYLSAFSSVGGIQRFNRLFMKAGEEADLNFRAISLYDTKSDSNYFKSVNFTGHANKKFKFLTNSLIRILGSDCIIIGHINLYLLGIAALILRKKVLVITHGIEVWENRNIGKNFLLKKASKVLCVSNYTKDKLVKEQGVSVENIDVVFNAIDPGFTALADKIKETSSKNENKKTILSVCRLSSDEKYKGYDKVMEALPLIISSGTDVKYIIAGRWDEPEFTRIKQLIQKLDLKGVVEIAGEVNDEELVRYYSIADLFIMPSKGEGFGIVFLEALYCGLPVIAGNRDGSVEPLMKGDLGILVDPDSRDEIAVAIINCIEGNVPENILNPSFLKNKVIEKFGFQKFKYKIEQVFLN